MVQKVLFISNTDRHINLCHLEYLKMFKDSGYEVHVATNSDKKIKYCDQKIKLSLKRNPFSFLNVFATFKIRKIVKQEEYSVISCHTPIGGVLGRLASLGLKKHPKVFYTAHGFHFFKGAGILNWIIYYNAEKFLSRFTDALFTMNNEDYKIAKRKFKCDVYKINGIGVNKERLAITDNNLRDKLNLENKYVITYIAEISRRKNQKVFIKEINKYDLEKEDIEVLFIGDSRIKNFDRYISKYKNMKYINFQANVGNYLNISDLVFFPSKQEGLPLSVLEAMYFNKMIISTNIRGCNDLITNNVNGILIPKNDIELMAKKIIEYKNSKKKLNINNNIEKYMINNVIDDVRDIYNKYLEEKLMI